MKPRHLPSLGGWIGILYGTIVFGSELVGMVVHSASPDGLALGYLSGFIVALILWYAVIVIRDWHRSDD